MGWDGNAHRSSRETDTGEPRVSTCTKRAAAASLFSFADGQQFHVAASLEDMGRWRTEVPLSGLAQDRPCPDNVVLPTNILLRRGSAAVRLNLHTC